MIDIYHFGNIVIDGQKYTSDVIVYPDKVRSNWWRQEGHRLVPEDIRELVSWKPEVLIVGTGSMGCMKISPETEELLKAQKIELIAEPTPRACQIFNQISASRRAVAALHLTC